MLPTKVKQIDYSEIEYIVEKVCEEKLQTVSFDCILTTSVSGTFVAGLISKKLNIPMYYSSNEEDFNIDNLQKILLVDLVCSDNNLNSLKEKLTEIFKNKQFLTFGVLVDNTSDTLDYVGIRQDVYYLTPWNKGSYTPQTHLSRLLDESKDAFEKNQSFVGFSSRKCYETVFLYHNKCVNISDYSIIDEDINKKITSSQINIEESTDRNLSIKDYYLRNKPYFLNKIEFINSNGITHFYEDSIRDAIILSLNCPITKIIFLDNNGLYSIKTNPLG